MNFAYLILVYKNFEQLRRLVASIDDERSHIFIHVDKKVFLSDTMRAEISSLARNVHFASRRVEVFWGGFRLLDGALIVMRDYLDSPFRADMIHLCTDSDGVIRPRQELVEFIRSHPAGSTFMRHTAIPTPFWSGGGLKRLEYRWHYDQLPLWANLAAIKVQQIFHLKRSLPAGVKPYGGSSWMSLSHAAIEYISAQSTAENALFRHFRHVAIPDESYFHTLIMNSQLATTVVNNNLRYIIWEPISPHPDKLGEEHRKEWEASRQFFARKFTPVPLPKPDMRERWLAFVGRLKNIIAVW